MSEARWDSFLLGVSIDYRTRWASRSPKYRVRGRTLLLGLLTTSLWLRSRPKGVLITEGSTPEPGFSPLAPRLCCQETSVPTAQKRPAGQKPRPFCSPALGSVGLASSLLVHFGRRACRGGLLDDVRADTSSPGSTVTMIHLARSRRVRRHITY